MITTITSQTWKNLKTFSIVYRKTTICIKKSTTEFGLKQLLHLAFMVCQNSIKKTFHYGQFYLRSAVFIITVHHGWVTSLNHFDNILPRCKTPLNLSIKSQQFSTCNKNFWLVLMSKSLFTNIPLDFTLNLILDKLFTDQSIKIFGMNRNTSKSSWIGHVKAARYSLITNWWICYITSGTSNSRCLHELDFRWSAKKDH